MSRQLFPKESKIEAVKQVTKHGYPVAEVANRPVYQPTTCING